MAGSATAVAAARLGLRVALIQDRPVLGGNTSSDVRVSLGGAINLPPYPSIGIVVAEMDPGHAGNAGPAANYDDEKKLGVVKAEKNVRLFLNTRAYKAGEGRKSYRFRCRAGYHEQPGVEVSRSAVRRLHRRRIRRIHGRCGLPVRAREPGGDRRVHGTDHRRQTRDGHVRDVVFEDAGHSTGFPETPWALPFNDQTAQNATRGDWDWETGQNRDQVGEFESIRDHAFRAIYGNWSFQKNHSANKLEVREPAALVGLRTSAGNESRAVCSATSFFNNRTSSRIASSRTRR